MKIERQLQGTLNTIITELVKEQGLDKRIQPYPAQEEGRADITLKDRNGKPIFFIELKDPTAKVENKEPLTTAFRKLRPPIPGHFDHINLLIINCDFR